MVCVEPRPGLLYKRLCSGAMIGTQTSASHGNGMRMWALWLHPWVTTNPARAFSWSGRGGPEGSWGLGQLSFASIWQGKLGKSGGPCTALFRGLGHPEPTPGLASGNKQIVCSVPYPVLREKRYQRSSLLRSLPFLVYMSLRLQMLSVALCPVGESNSGCLVSNLAPQFLLDLQIVSVPLTVCLEL